MRTEKHKNTTRIRIIIFVALFSFPYHEAEEKGENRKSFKWGGRLSSIFLELSLLVYSIRLPLFAQLNVSLLTQKLCTISKESERFRGASTTGKLAGIRSLFLKLSFYCFLISFLRKYSCNFDIFKTSIRTQIKHRIISSSLKLFY